MAVEFDGENKLILISSGTTTINVKDNVYEPWKQWTITGSNLEYLPAMRAIGGDPTVSGQFLGSTFFMLNDWRIRSWEGTHELTINGNLYVDGGGNPFIPPTGSHTITYTRVVSNLVDALGSENSTTTIQRIDTVLNQFSSSSIFATGYIRSGTTNHRIYSSIVTQHNKFYDKHQIIISSGSLKSARFIDQHIQYSDHSLFLFLRPLEFVPVSGSEIHVTSLLTHK